MTTTDTIRAKVADSRAVTKFRDAPSELAAAHPELARRATVARQTSGMLGTTYTYRLHADRTAAHKYANGKDNSVRLVIP
jgi:hypothetical protein